MQFLKEEKCTGSKFPVGCFAVRVSVSESESVCWSPHGATCAARRCSSFVFIC